MNKPETLLGLKALLNSQYVGVQRIDPMSEQIPVLILVEGLHQEVGLWREDGIVSRLLQNNERRSPLTAAQRLNQG